MGGRSVRPENRAYSRDNDLARRAAQKGGTAPHVSRGGVPDPENLEIWSGRKVARVRKLAAAGWSLVGVREDVGSKLNIPVFRLKCKRLDIVFTRTRPAIPPVAGKPLKRGQRP